MHVDIEHHWYKKWGAFQLPQDTNGLITFLQDVSEAKKSRPGPILVQCRYVLYKVKTYCDSI